MGELGTRLRDTREARGLTIEDAERDTRISRKYLDALENEQFELIPAPVYARGFLRSYSQYLGLNPQELLGLFPSEDGSDGTTTGDKLKPSREKPLPAVSRSRPAWTSPRAESPAPRPAPKAPASSFPGSRSQPPKTIPDIPSEPTIGVDIGLPIPARKLGHDSAVAGRAAAALAVAAVAIAVVLGIAWLIARSGGDEPAPGASDGPPGVPTTTIETPTSSVPSVARGVVPDVRGLSAERANELVAAAGYEVVERLVNSPNVPKGNVTDQSPAPGTQLSEGQEVGINVSDGP